jgi:hypothetical protein
VVQGPSSSGKSFAVERALWFIPKEAVERVTKMTPKALAYEDDGHLKNKFLFIGEKAGVAKGDGQDMLRQMLSEGRIIHKAVVNEGGVRRTETKTIEGPMGLLMTTTDSDLHPEDENRVVLYRLQSNSERVKQLLKRQALQSAGMDRGANGHFVKRVKLEVHDREPWLALDKTVSGLARQGVKVTIPFAPRIIEKSDHNLERASRDFEKLWSLVKAHALLHHQHRQRDKDTGAIVATLEDYGIVRELLEPPLADSVLTEVHPHVRTIVKRVESFNGAGVSQAQLARVMGQKQGAINRHITSAKADGYLKETNPGKGKQGRLVLGETNLPSGKVLPTMQEVAPERKKKKPKPKKKRGR